MKSLFGAVGPPGADRLARYLAEWLAGSNARLQRTAAQVRVANTSSDIGANHGHMICVLYVRNMLLSLVVLEGWREPSDWEAQ